MSILGRDHTAFFTSHQVQEMIYMPDEIILVRMLTVLDLEFEKAMHYHDEGYEGDNDCGLTTQVMMPFCVCSVFTTEASFDPAKFTIAQHPISPFMRRHPRSLPFQEGVHQCLTCDEISPPMPEGDSEDEGDLLTVYLDDPVWSEEPYQTAGSTCAYMKYLD